MTLYHMCIVSCFLCISSWSWKQGIKGSRKSSNDFTTPGHDMEVKISISIR